MHKTLLGYMSNLSPNYEGVIQVGLLAKKEEADECGGRVIDTILNLSDRYKARTIAEGKVQLAAVM